VSTLLRPLDDASGDSKPSPGAGRRNQHLLTMLGLRWCLTALLLGGLAALVPGILDVYATSTIILLGLGLNFTSPFTLRNYYLLYTVAFFLIGSRIIYPNLHNIFNFDAAVYLAAFLAGHLLYFWSHRTHKVKEPSPRSFSPLAAKRIEMAFWALAGAQLVRLALLIKQFGLGGFYSGQELAYRIQSYRESGSTGAAVTTFAITALSASITALHCEYCLRTGVRPRYLLLAFVLIVMPLISLQRNNLILNSALLAAVYVSMRRIQAHRPDRAPAGSRQSNVSVTARRRLIPALVLLLVGVVMAIKIGDIRGRSLERQSGQTDSSNSLQQVLQGEFTPISFYYDVKHNMDKLGYRYGTNIVGGLATRFIPRSLWPDKPITSQEYFMRQLQPDALARGLSLAPSLFGVGYLNFGMIGTAILVALLGWGAAHYDRAYVHARPSGIPQFLILSAWAYSLMRDDLATSLAGVLLSFGLYRLLRGLTTGQRGVQPAPAVANVAGVGEPA
jgi:oligosaccharide repeat unit polymerase